MVIKKWHFHKIQDILKKVGMHIWTPFTFIANNKKKYILPLEFGFLETAVISLEDLKYNIHIILVTFINF